MPAIYSGEEILKERAWWTQNHVMQNTACQGHIISCSVALGPLGCSFFLSSLETRASWSSQVRPDCTPGGVCVCVGVCTHPCILHGMADHTASIVLQLWKGSLSFNKCLSTRGPPYMPNTLGLKP